MIKKVRASRVPALFFGLLLVIPGAAGATPDEARQRGSKFLLDTQLPVGGWVSAQFGLTSTGHKIAITAVAAHALVAANPNAEALAAAARAVGFIRRYEGELRKPRINDGFDYTPWAAAYGLVHLNDMIWRWPEGEDPPPVEELVQTFAQYALRTQRPCGGWDYRLAGAGGGKLEDGSVPFLTAVMLDGLRACGAVEKVRARAVLDLERSMDEKGRLGYSQDGDYAEVRSAPWWSPPEAAGRTLQARLVLARCGKSTKFSLLAAVKEFLAVRADYAAARGKQEHTEPHEIAGYYYYHAHYYAMCALRYLLEQDPGREEWVESQARVLSQAFLAEQNDDGSWEDAPAGGKAYGTALALLALREYRDIRVRWCRSLSAGLKRARRDGRPLVLLFLDANEASGKMVQLFYSAALAEAVGSVVLLRLNRRSNPEIALKARVYRGPALLVLDPRQENPLKNPMKKLIGARDADKIRAVLEKSIAGF